MPGVKKVRFASPPVLSPMSHDELDDYEAAEAAARAAYDDDETAAITARDEERGDRVAWSAGAVAGAGGGRALRCAVRPGRVGYNTI